MIGRIVMALMVVAWPALAEDEKKTELKEGDKAPEFEWPSPDGEGTVKLSDLKGEKSVLLAFYPKAFTGGCTKQLCGYRDDFGKFQSADTEVVAISTDKQEESDKFREHYEMPFAVLGDPEHKVVDAYGVPLKDYQGNQLAQRAVILVDKNGEIQYVDMDYKIGEDEQDLYEAVFAERGEVGSGQDQPKV